MFFPGLGDHHHDNVWEGAAGEHEELEAVVENVGNAVNPPNIAPTEGQAGEVPQIQPTFDWVRLPQRVPVRIRFTQLPDDIQLISGTTASVAVRPSARE